MHHLFQFHFLRREDRRSLHLDRLGEHLGRLGEQLAQSSEASLPRMTNGAATPEGGRKKIPVYWPRL